MSWPHNCFFSFLIFFLSFIFFHTIEDWSSVYVMLRGKFCPNFCSMFQNLFKVWCWLWPEPSGAWLLCSGSRQELRFVICRWHEQCLARGCWGGFCKAKSVMCDMMWLGLHITTTDKLIQLVKTLLALCISKFLLVWISVLPFYSVCC